MFKAYEILDIAIKLEKNAEEIYRSSQELLNDEELKVLIVWMADEERRHKEWFSNLKKQLSVDDEDAILKEMSEELLKDFIGKASFSLEDANFSEIKDLKALISTFIEFENDTILFYELIQSFVSDDETTEKIDQIILEEKQHIRKLETFL